MMYIAKMKFDILPEIGFAHQHYSSAYGVTYGQNKRKCVEIAYIRSGTVRIQLHDIYLDAPKGSVLVLFRHLPISTQTIGDEIQSHVTILAEFDDYELEIIEAEKDISTGDTLCIPFITLPSPKNEEIGQKIQKIASRMTSDRVSLNLYASIEFISILNILSEQYKERQKQRCNPPQKLCRKICLYIDDNIDKRMTVESIAEHVGKSSNYVGAIFKKEYGISLSQYINAKKVKRLIMLMQKEGQTFNDACKTLSLHNPSYAYRLFKTYTGVTPTAYLKTLTIKRD